MSSAPKYVPHYTVAEYRQWDGDWELWSGVPVAMTPSPFGWHQAVASRLIRLLGSEFERAGCGDCEVLHDDWQIGDDTVVRPDVVVVCGGVPERYLTDPPAVVVEVLSPSTVAKDRGPKRELYQQQGVEHYLIADPGARLVQRYRLTKAGQYIEAPLDQPLALHETCQITLDTTTLFHS